MGEGGGKFSGIERIWLGTDTEKKKKKENNNNNKEKYHRTACPEENADWLKYILKIEQINDDSTYSLVIFFLLMYTTCLIQTDPTVKYIILNQLN